MKNTDFEIRTSVKSTDGLYGVQRMPDGDTAARVGIPDSGTNTAPCT